MQKINKTLLKPVLSRLLVLSILAGHSAVALGASFDCSKAKASAEKLICSNDELSRLDSELNVVYNAAVGTTENSKGLVNSQRTWIVEIRNRCSDGPCLSEAYKARIGWLKSKSTKGTGPCGIDNESILGNWQRVKGGDFEEFAFSVAGGERDFSSWLHHRPEYMGKWELKGCTLHVAHGQNRALDFDYQVLGLRGDILYLKNFEDGEEASYRRIRK